MPSVLKGNENGENMIHKGCCYDNPPTELKKQQNSALLSMLLFYNGKRAHSKRLSFPLKYERIFRGRLLNKVPGLCEALPYVDDLA